MNGLEASLSGLTSPTSRRDDLQAQPLTHIAYHPFLYSSILLGVGSVGRPSKKVPKNAYKGLPFTAFLKRPSFSFPLRFKCLSEGERARIHLGIGLVTHISFLCRCFDSPSISFSLAPFFRLQYSYRLSYLLHSLLYRERKRFRDKTSSAFHNRTRSAVRGNYEETAFNVPKTNEPIAV